MASWVRTITSPFRKACTFFNHNHHHHHHQNRDKKSQQGARDQGDRTMDLQGEVMACGYDDVQVMWSILDKSKPRTCNLTS